MIKIVRNPKTTAVCGWNIGIKQATGDLILIAGSHSTYPPNYVGKCVEWSSQAENVGGGIVSVVRQDVSGFSRALNLSRDDLFGAGVSVFRQGSETPTFVDTVFGGCYRREVFEKIGLFNEKLDRSGDLEFNLRLKEAGMKTLYVPEIKSTYFARSDWWSFVKHNFKDGKWSLLMMKYSNVNFGKRRLIPALFVATIPVSIFPYLVVSMIRSFQLSIREKNWRLFFSLPLAFFSLHFSYGLGSLWAIPRFLRREK